jgi:hypothetical protein
LSYEQQSSLAQLECQDIIDSIGDYFDPDNPTVQMLSKTLNAVSIARTGEDGEFELLVDHQYIFDDPMSHMIAIEKNFMSAKQSFSYMLPIDKDSPEPIRTLMYEPDADGVIRFSEMRLFPSAKIELELNLPNMSSNGRYPIEVKFQYHTKPDDPTPWLKKLWATPRERMGASTVRQSRLRPNGRQTITVPAGVELSLIIYTLRDDRAGISFDGIKLEQVQSLDLGLIEFPPSLRVYVKVIDYAGNPVPGITVTCSHKNGFYWGEKSDTSAEGTAILNVWPNAEGRFSVSHRDKDTDEILRESVPYEVRGEEDAGTEFILQLSDEILSKLSE